ncbi:MAG: ABC transporter permease [bacterium]|nr:ABC transporter permease [bacterium]MDT8395764.1 ABC transporter permease [bacterium]
MRIIAALDWVGTRTLSYMDEAGTGVLLFLKVLRGLFHRPFPLKLTLEQMEEVGVRSLPVVLITAIFTGAVLALQTYSGFKRFGAEGLVGTVVALSMTRELGPVLASIMVAGRVGSSMAAELGTMRVTEQIDALITLATDPVRYLVLPRFIAGLFMLPILVVFADLIGIMGGYFVAVNVLGTSSTTYINRTLQYLEFSDVSVGLVKAAVFGMIISLVGCQMGFFTEGGAEGVGRATTKAVVGASILILISNYFLTALLF